MIADHDMNLLAGRRLSDFITEEPAPFAQMVPAFLESVAAVEELHRRYDSPCNLDPGNVVLLMDGKVVLKPVVRLSKAATIALPSLKYSSPEILEEISDEYGANVLDSYTLGFVFYEIFLGRGLFRRQFAEVIQEGEIGWLKWHLDQDKCALSLSSQLKDFPLVLSRLIDEMITKKPAARLANFRSISDTLACSMNATVSIASISSLRIEERALKERRSQISRIKEIVAVFSRLSARLRNAVIFWREV